MTGKNSTIGGGGFHHVAIRARDFDRSVQLYTETFGFVPTIAWGEAPKRAIMLDTGDGNFLEIFERTDEPPAAAEPAPVQLHFALRTEDTDAATEVARAAGCEITMEPKTVALNNTVAGGNGPVNVRISFFKGPDGEEIEMFQHLD